MPDVDIVVYDDDFARAEGDEHAAHLLATNNQVKVMTRTLNGWRKPSDWEPTASRRLHLHFFHSPVEVLGTDAVEGVRFERTRPVGDGSVRTSALRLPGGQVVRLSTEGDEVSMGNGAGSQVVLTEQGTQVHSVGDLVIEAPGHRIILRADAIDMERG